MRSLWKVYRCKNRYKLVINLWTLNGCTTIEGFVSISYFCSTVTEKWNHSHPNHSCEVVVEWTCQPQQNWPTSLALLYSLAKHHPMTVKTSLGGWAKIFTLDFNLRGSFQRKNSKYRKNWSNSALTHKNKFYCKCYCTTWSNQILIQFLFGSEPD